MNRAIPDQRVKDVLRPEKHLLESFDRQSVSLYFQQAQKRSTRCLVTQVFLAVLLVYAITFFYEMRP